MKKMLIAAVAVISVIASIVGCQVYDSQTNENLYHAGVKLQDLAADFNSSCLKLYENSDDVSAYNDIVDAFWNFTEYFERKTAMTAVKAYVSKDLTDKCKKACEDNNIMYTVDAGGKVVVVNKSDESKYNKLANPLKEAANASLQDVDWCKSTYKQCFMTKEYVYNFVKSNKTDDNDFANSEIEGNGDHEAWSIKSLWEKTYKLKWDYNSKK